MDTPTSSDDAIKELAAAARKRALTRWLTGIALVVVALWIGLLENGNGRTLSSSAARAYHYGALGTGFALSFAGAVFFLLFPGRDVRRFLIGFIAVSAFTLPSQFKRLAQDDLPYQTGQSLSPEQARLYRIQGLVSERDRILAELSHVQPFERAQLSSDVTIAENQNRYALLAKVAWELSELLPQQLREEHHLLGEVASAAEDALSFLRMQWGNWQVAPDGVLSFQQAAHQSRVESMLSRVTQAQLAYENARNK